MFCKWKVNTVRFTLFNIQFTFPKSEKNCNPSKCLRQINMEPYVSSSASSAHCCQGWHKASREEEVWLGLKQPWWFPASPRQWSKHLGAALTSSPYNGLCCKSCLHIALTRLCLYIRCQWRQWTHPCCLSSTPILGMNPYSSWRIIVDEVKTTPSAHHRDLFITFPFLEQHSQGM